MKIFRCGGPYANILSFQHDNGIHMDGFLFIYGQFGKDEAFRV